MAWGRGHLGGLGSAQGRGQGSPPGLLGRQRGIEEAEWGGRDGAVGSGSRSPPLPEIETKGYEIERAAPSAALVSLEACGWGHWDKNGAPAWARLPLSRAVSC